MLDSYQTHYFSDSNFHCQHTMLPALKEILVNIAVFKEEAPIFAKRVQKEFRPDSEAVALELTEEELGLPTDEMAALKCSGFDYFLDVFIVQEMVADFERSSQPVFLNERMAAVIHYAEHDA